MARVFISYRRSDGADLAAQVSRALKAQIPAAALFLDVEGIKLGEDFSQVIFDHIQSCDVVVLVITEDWIGEVLAKEKETPNWVRIELETALRLRKIIVPILSQNASDFYQLELPSTIADVTRWQAFQTIGDSSVLQKAALEVKGKLDAIKDERIESLARKITKPKGAILQVWKALKLAHQTHAEQTSPEDIWRALIDSAKQDYGEKRWKRVLTNYRLTSSEDVGLVIFACIVEGFFLTSDDDDASEYWDLASLEDE